MFAARKRPPLRSLWAGGAAVTALFLLPAAALASTQAPEPVPGETRQVVLVGNNWEGTTDILDATTYERLDRINVIPDLQLRLSEIYMSPVKLGFFLAIRELVGEGHDQFNDDVFSSHDGRTIFVSRPSFADVVAIDLASKQIKWRTPVSGYRSDHMAISPDGTKLLVSASTGNVVHQIDTETGQITGEFPSGDSPHENNYSNDGSRIFHASIGRVYTPVDRPPVEPSTKGARYFQVVDANTLQIIKRLDIGKELADDGYPDFSSAMRPMALSPDERFLYFQVSFFHGFIEYDLETEHVTRIARLPLSAEAAGLQPEEYLLDSAHHGLALNPEGTKLCVAGTMSDYAAIVDRQTFAARILDSGRKPYWSTNSADGRHCYVSSSGDDQLTVISYETEQVVTKVPVGDHPQRVRNGVARLEQYPLAVPDTQFRLALSHRRPLRIGRHGTRVACRARGAPLARCLVRIQRGRTVLAHGERIMRGRSAFPVRVELTRAGRALLRRSRGRVGATIVAQGTDAAGRTRTLRKRVRLQRAG